MANRIESVNGKAQHTVTIKTTLPVEVWEFVKILNPYASDSAALRLYLLEEYELHLNHLRERGGK